MSVRQYMVIADGAGEYECDYSIAWFDAKNASEAAELAISPEQGYGRRDGGTIYVVPVSAVAKFSTEEQIIVRLAPAISNDGS